MTNLSPSDAVEGQSQICTDDLQAGCRIPELSVLFRTHGGHTPPERDYNLLNRGHLQVPTFGVCPCRSAHSSFIEGAIDFGIAPIVGCGFPPGQRIPVVSAHTDLRAPSFG